MKLKKAVREYARAVDELALVTERIRWAVGLSDLTSELLNLSELLEWRDEARREKQRTVRQMNAVMVAMQYRGVSDGGDPLKGLTTDSVCVSGLHSWLYLQKYLWRLSRGYASPALKLALAKRACEFYLRNGDMKYGRYFIEDYYRMIFGVEVQLLEH